MVATQVGKFTLSGLQLRSPVDRLESWTVNRFSCRGVGTFEQTNYPGTMYCPVVVLRNTLYNLSAAMCYQAVEYNHNFNVRYQIGSAAATNPSTIVFFAAFNNQHDPVFTIPAGQTRIYTIKFRINDRTDTPIGSAADAPSEWLWTLRAYQQHFRHLYGKPNYRAMGGWDGRPVASYNTSHAPGAYADRWWQNSANNPETTGPPDGYFKFSTFALAKQTLNIDRVIIWALSGWHEDEGFNYAFRFASGVFDPLAEIGFTEVFACARRSHLQSYCCRVQPQMRPLFSLATRTLSSC